jgi:hypothetical protein
MLIPAAADVDLHALVETIHITAKNQNQSPACGACHLSCDLARITCDDTRHARTMRTSSTYEDVALSRDTVVVVPPLQRPCATLYLPERTALVCTTPTRSTPACLSSFSSCQLSMTIRVISHASLCMIACPCTKFHGRL